jgi:hypothetical protein
MKVAKQAPPNLYFRLVTIQNFPQGQKVALYFCEQLKKYFSVNYGKEGIQLSESEFSIIDKLKGINEVEPLYFNDGSSLNINRDCSNHILKLYEEIVEGKSEFEEFLLISDKSFLSLLDYSVNKFKKET